jgi:hypothetical protein
MKRKTTLFGLMIFFVFFGLLFCTSASAKLRTLSWTAPTTYLDGSTIGVDDSITYSIWRKDVIPNITELIAEDLSGTSLEFDDAALVMGRSYAFWMQSYSALYGLSSSDSSTYYWTVPFSPILTSPADNATGVARPVAFTWQAVAGAISYSLEVDDDPEFLSPNVDIETDQTNWTTDVLDGSTKYYWRVRANR